MTNWMFRTPAGLSVHGFYLQLFTALTLFPANYTFRATMNKIFGEISIPGWGDTNGPGFGEIDGTGFGEIPIGSFGEVPTVG